MNPLTLPVVLAGTSRSNVEMGNTMRQLTSKLHKSTKSLLKGGTCVPTVSYSSSEDEEDDFFDATDTIRYDRELDV